MPLIVTKTPQEVANDRVVGSISRSVQAARRTVQDVSRLLNDQEEVVAVEASEGVEAVEGKTKLQVLTELLGENYPSVASAVASLVALVNTLSDTQITNPLE